MKLINEEFSLGRVAGPFANPQLPNIRLLPIGLVLKKDGSLKFIHYLLYPKGSSVNDSIDIALLSTYHLIRI